MTEMLIKNFERAYYGQTRGPIGLYMHAAWFFGQPWHFDGYIEAIRQIANNYNDTWIVPIRAGIEYMKNPVPISDLDTYPPFGCDNLPTADCSFRTCV